MCTSETLAPAGENGEIGYENTENGSAVTNYDLKDEVDSKKAMIDALDTKGLKMEDIPGHQDGLSAEYGRMHTENNGSLTDKQIEKWSKTKHPKYNISYGDIFRGSGGSTKMNKTTKPKKKIKR